MSEAKVSIIIPVLNRASLLPRLFCSLEKITYNDMQIILVDNGSKDDSLEVCRQYAKDSKFTVEVLDTKSPGANAARNRGLSHCQTEWVYFFDSDDEVSPDFLDRLMPHTENVDLVAFATRLEEKGKLRKRDFICSKSICNQIVTGTLNTQGMLIRTKFLCDVGGWNEELSVWQDWELGVRLLFARPKIYWYKKHAFHILHQHPNSITQNSRTRDRLHAMEAVGELLLTHRQRRALHYRFCILQGQLLYEGSGKRITSNRHVRLITRWHGWLLKTYTRFGGRGAWRMARWMV